MQSSLAGGGGGWVGMPRDTRFVAEENVLVKFLVNSRSEQLQNVINIFEREV